jgi:hypothetical protein
MDVAQYQRAVLAPPSDELLADEFGYMTSSDRMTRRQAIQALAKKHGTRSNDVYAAVERVRKLGR